MLRVLLDVDEGALEIVFAVLVLSTIVPYMLLVLFLGIVHVPKLNETMENLYSSGIHNLVQWQVITLLGYVNIDYSDTASTILKSQSSWIFLDYLDDQELVDQDDSDFGDYDDLKLTSDWSI